MSFSSENEYDFLNSGLMFTPEICIQSKKVWEPVSRERGTINFDITSRSFAVILLIYFDF